MKPCAVSGKILHQVLVFVVSCVTLLFRCQLPSLVRPNPSKVFSSFKILRCYHFYGFPHSLTALTAFIDSWAGPLNQNIGQAVQSQKDWCHFTSGYPSASKLGPYHFLSSTLMAYFGPEAWRAPSPGQPSWHFLPCALLGSHVQTALKPDLVAGRENYISLNDTQRFVKYLLCAWHFMAVIAFIFIHKLSCILFFPLSR